MQKIERESHRLECAESDNTSFKVNGGFVPITGHMF